MRWLLVRLLREGFRWRLALLAGLATSAAIMAKLIVFPLVGLFAGTLVICPGQPASRLRRLWALAVPVVCLMPLAWRNTRLYGDPLVAGAMNEVMATLVNPHPLFSPYFIGDFPYYMWRSFIGLFGWMNILMSEWVYNGYLGLTVPPSRGSGWRSYADACPFRSPCCSSRRAVSRWPRLWVSTLATPNRRGVTCFPRWRPSGQCSASV